MACRCDLRFSKDETSVSSRNSGLETQGSLGSTSRSWSVAKRRSSVSSSFDKYEASVSRFAIAPQCISENSRNFSMCLKHSLWSINSRS